MGVFEMKQKTTSVFIAKDRLKQLLVSDRAECTPEMLEMLKRDLYNAVSKYMKIEPDEFEIQMNRKEIHIYLSGEEL